MDLWQPPAEDRPGGSDLPEEAGRRSGRKPGSLSELRQIKIIKFFPAEIKIVYPAESSGVLLNPP
jgi:hypothetical protein